MDVGPPELQLSIDCHPPSMDGVWTAVRKLKTGMAPGPDGIPPELLKVAGDTVILSLHDLFVTAWTHRKVPAEWRQGIIIPIFKGKGSRMLCKNYRPISLLSIPGKVFALVLLQRIQPLLLLKQRPEQSGFTPSRSTSDAIVALRILAELQYQFRKPLHVAHVDIKGAFDSVDRAQLWKVLRSRGLPECFVELLASFHSGTSACVRVESELSEPFLTSSGVRQGCVLAPSLFCSAMDWILHHCHSDLGISILGSSFTDLLYADDAALFSPDPTLWPNILESFRTSASQVGLTPSWAKTKIQNIGYGRTPDTLQLNTDLVEAVDSFRYLGCDFADSGQCCSEVLRRIALASSIMGQLNQVWRQKFLSLRTKTRIYCSCVQSVLLYGCDTWTLRKYELRRLESFHMSCQHRILGVRWFDFVRNDTIAARTGLGSIGQVIAARQHSLFGHIRRMSCLTPAHKALKLAVDISAGLRPDASWVRPCGRPRLSWPQQVANAAGASLQECWRLAADRGGWRSRRPFDGLASE